MTIRERLEQQEYMLLAPNAQKAAESRKNSAGRDLYLVEGRGHARAGAL